MNIGVSQSIAQNIVETVKDFCGHDINFIDRDGYIFASTDPDRIGDFHEIGKKVVETETPIEVYSEDDYTGTLPGINEPFFYGGRIMAVIGITGDPDKVRQYSKLASRITMLIFKENEYTSKNFDQQTATNYIIRSLISGEPLNKNRFKDFMESRNLSLNASYRTCVVKINPRYNPSNISLIEQDILYAFSSIKNSMYRFQYPNEFVLIFEASSLYSARKTLQKLLDKYKQIISIAIGSEESITRQNRSYEAATLSLKSITTNDKVGLYEEFDLTLLLSSIGTNVSSRYLKKTIGSLTTDEINVLKSYYDNNMSLKDASEELYIHKNTLQYKLDKIYEKCSYNPRNFHDANILYLALRLNEIAT